MTRKISQREARRTRQELSKFELKYRAIMRSFTSSYPGVHIRNVPAISSETQEVLNTATRLGFVLAAKVDGDVLRIYAVKG